MSSIVKLKDLATGPTIGRAVAKYENESALREVETAIVDTYLSVSVVSAPNILKAAPANAAASGNSEPVACAKRKINLVDCKISLDVNPNFANSICKLVASAAVYLVVDPSARASICNSFVLSAVVPSMAASFELAASKSMAVRIPCLKLLHNPNITFITA